MSNDTVPAATLARAIRDTCIERLRRDYEEAAIQGLCGEGAFEYALDRLRHFPVESLVEGIDDSPAQPDEGNDP